MSEPRVVCVVPALNAGATLETVVVGLRSSLPSAFITVVDDGSSDDTLQVARRSADVVERFTRNRGKGAALRRGFSLALAHGADVIVTVDADGQHDPRVAPALVQALETADLVVGARDRRSPAMPRGRRLTNRLSAAAVAYCIGHPVADAQCGYRAIARRVVCDVTPRGDRYEFETEFLIVAARRGHRISFVPVPTVYHSPVPSQFRPLRDSARIVGALWRFGIGDN